MAFLSFKIFKYLPIVLRMILSFQYGIQSPSLLFQVAYLNTFPLYSIIQ